MSADVQQVAWRNPSAHLRQVVAGADLTTLVPLAASQGGQQSQGWLVINDTAATFVLDVWAGGGNGRPGTGAMRVPLGAASWVQIPVCQGAIGIDPTTVQGGGTGSVYIYELYGPVEWSAGVLRQVETTWWLDVDLPPVATEWKSPWGGTVVYTPQTQANNMGHIRVGPQFSGTIAISPSQPGNYYEIGPGFAGTITENEGCGGIILRVGRAFTGAITLNSPLNRITIGDGCSTSLTLGPTAAGYPNQSADVVIGNEDASTISLTGYQPVVRIGNAGAATVQELTQSGYSGPLSYQCAAYIGDGSSVTVNFVATASAGQANQARVKCDDQASAAVYIATGYYHVYSGESRQVGSLSTPWTGAPGVPRLLVTVPYSQFTQASTSIYPYVVGSLNRHARARTFVMVNSLNEPLTNALYALYDSATQSGNPSGMIENVSESQALYSGNQWVAASESASSGNHGLLAAKVDSVQIGLGMGSTLPTSGNVYVYVAEEYD